MRPAIIAVAAIIFMSSVGFSQEPVLRWSAAPLINSLGGELEYEIEALFQASPGTIGTLRSLLEYPQDVHAAGLELVLDVDDSTRPQWRFALSFQTNLNDPDDLMKDHDWVQIPYVIDDKVQYSESPSDVDLLHISANIRRYFIGSPRWALGIDIGGSFQRFEQTMVGFSGWYLDQFNQQQPFNGTDSALAYKMTHAFGELGLGGKFYPGEKIAADVVAAFVLSSYSDEDDHLIRNFRQKSSGVAPGFKFRMDFLYEPFGRRSGLVPFLKVSTVLLRISGSSDATRVYYGDDPGTPEDEYGLRIADIPSKVRLSTHSVGVAVGLFL